MNHIQQFIPNILFGQKNVCTYCGQEATTIDHVVPVSFYGVPRNILNNDNGIRTYACQSCNSSLGSRVFLTFKARLTHISSVHKKKSLKTKSKWSEKELVELDFKLQTFIRHRKNVSDTNSNKVSWIGSSRFRRTIKNLQDYKEFNPCESSYIDWLAKYFVGYMKGHSED